MTKKTVIPESVLTLEMQSHAAETVSRRCRCVVQEIVQQKHAYYDNLSEVVRRIDNLKLLSAWQTTVSEANLILHKFWTFYNTEIPEFTVTVDVVLGYIIKVYDWYIPEDHEIYCTYRRSIKNVTVSDLVNILVSYFKSPGIPYITNETNIYRHIIPIPTIQCVPYKAGTDLISFFQEGMMIIGFVFSFI